MDWPACIYYLAKFTILALQPSRLSFTLCRPVCSVVGVHVCTKDTLMLAVGDYKNQSFTMGSHMVVEAADTAATPQTSAEAPAEAAPQAQPQAAQPQTNHYISHFRGRRLLGRKAALPAHSRGVIAFWFPPLPWLTFVCRCHFAHHARNTSSRAETDPHSLWGVAVDGKQCSHDSVVGG